MSEQVTLPAVGPVSKKALWIGGGGAVLVMGVLWWRKRTTAAATPVDPTDPNALDTGATTTGSGGGGSGGGLDTGLPQVGVPTSNPQWTALVMQQLAGAAADPTALAAALGRYLTGQAVTTDQELLIDEAIASAGYPPVDGPNGYPPAIHTQPATGQTPPPAPAPTPTPTPAGSATHPRYTIEHGDTLEGIAARFHTTKAQLLAWNLPDLDAYARRFGHANSNNGNLIFGGLPIRVG